MSQSEEPTILDVNALVSKGWLYKDLNWVKAGLFQFIIELYGEDGKDIVVIATSQRTRGDVFQRGQFFVSPEANERFVKWYNDGGLNRLRLEHPEWFGDDLSTTH